MPSLWGRAGRKGTRYTEVDFKLCTRRWATRSKPSRQDWERVTLPQHMLRNATMGADNPLIPHHAGSPLSLGTKPADFQDMGWASLPPGLCHAPVQACHPAPCAAQTLGGGSDDGSFSPVPSQTSRSSSAHSFRAAFRAGSSPCPRCAGYLKPGQANQQNPATSPVVHTDKLQFFFDSRAPREVHVDQTCG